MPKHPLRFIELHSPFFMQGSNLGTKIDAAQRGAKLILDDERQVVWVRFKGKVSFIPLPSIASADALEVPKDIQDLFEISSAAPEILATDAPKRRGRPPAQPAMPQAPLPSPTQVPYPDFDPNDEQAAAKHREMVRAASANSNRPEFRGPQNDDLIQAARMTAMGLKHQPSAQVQTAQQVGQTAGVTGKRKVMSHGELKAQVAREAKE